jgi:hypothetical protein
MSDKATKVLGYVAVQTGTINVLCDNNSCIVAGSEKNMEEYIAALSVDRNVTYRISKARFGQVISAMKLGAAYSFDRESFARFSPLARKEGIELMAFTPDNQAKPDDSAIPLMRVQWLAKE